MAGVPHGALIVLFRLAGADQADNCDLVGQDADNVGLTLDSRSVAAWKSVP
jgi:hypothetical protein